jgi:hypothetical protein
MRLIVNSVADKADAVKRAQPTVGASFAHEYKRVCTIADELSL